jgi:hypothetical protein
MDEKNMPMVTQINLTYPASGWGSHKAWKGPEVTRHLQHSV